jgi:SAM-dependent methyltransferase
MLLHRPDRAADRSPAAHPPVVWEDAACPLCGRDDAAVLTEAADPHPAPGTPGLRFAVVGCRHCGLAYTNPRPTPDTISGFYPPGYAPHDGRPARAARPPSRLRCRLLGRPCPEYLGRLPNPAPGRLLDFGCGGGRFLRRMAGLGWAVTGLDSSPEAVRAVRDGVGCEAVLGTLPHPDLEPGSFDAVTLWQSLEHVHRPLDVLREAHRLLVPGGSLVVAVPNFGGWAARRFGPHWFGLDLPRHLTHFTPDTLPRMLAAAGFRVTAVRGWAHPKWVWASAGRAGGFAGWLCRRKAARWAAWAAYAAGRADVVVAVAERPA